MSRRITLFSLLMLLILAHQGAVVHQLSHCPQAGHPDLQASLAKAADTDAACALCPAFAQAATPAFSHAFVLPTLLRVSAERRADRLFSRVTLPVPLTRS